MEHIKITPTIYGIGNPTQGHKNTQYAYTRHNVGKSFVTWLIEKYQLYPKVKKNYLLAEKKYNESFVQFITSETWMNHSGSPIMTFLKKHPHLSKHLLVVHDETELAFGDHRLQFDGGHKGHNGLRHIFEVLKTRKFYRLRLGVGRPEHSNLAAYVLSNFNDKEQLLLPAVFENIELEVNNWIVQLTS